MDFYLAKTAGITLDALSTNSPDVALLLAVIFKANGLGMTMSGIFALFIIVFATRKGEWPYTKRGAHSKVCPAYASCDSQPGISNLWP